MFDESKEYGNYICVFDEEEIETTKTIVLDNAKLIIPKEFQSFIKFPIIRHTKERTIKVTANNYEMLDFTKEDIGKILNIPEQWSVGWLYSKKYSRTG